nr:MAG TPA: hypothetical protein [Caudoviricetes sp.]
MLLINSSLVIVNFIFMMSTLKIREEALTYLLSMS